jgi:ribosomal protein L40E
VAISQCGTEQFQSKRGWDNARASQRRHPLAKKTCPRCKNRVNERAARCRRCGYSFPEKGSPWAAGPAYGLGFPLVVMSVLTMFILGASTGLVLGAGAVALAGFLLFFHPR